MAYTVVVGYDGSDGAKEALEKALELAKPLSGKVLITYAFGGPKQYSGAPLTPRRTLQELGEKLLHEAVERVSERGVDAEPVLVGINGYAVPLFYRHQVLKSVKKF